ncbi:hypothetical protein [uncultured Parasphingopyxis sp.]|uniref:hypothetical protein n=1 Tax=uncultured Parasphingopyxis sp. TaxID=1547918 RepID=UPI0026183929|nr:hypothetical protein [uncultured Parasphingopyxis sp.]
MIRAVPGIAAAATALALSACEDAPSTSVEDTPSIVAEDDAGDADWAPTSPPIFRGVGQEPGWIVRIYPDYIVYEADYGERTVRVRTPEAEAGEDTVRYVTDELTVEIADGECADVMSGARYGASVTVIEDGRSLSGCGGEELASAEEVN